MTTEEQLGQARKEAGEMLAQETGMPQYASAADFDARITQMLANDERQEREKQEQKIQRQQAAQTIADTWSIFGDMIKASEGAVVSPRDVQKRYAELDDNAKKVYDNYRARLDVLRKGIADRAKGDRDNALAIHLQNQKAAADEARWKAELEWKTRQAAADRAAQERISKRNSRSVRTNVTTKEDERIQLNMGRDIHGKPVIINIKPAAAGTMYGRVLQRIMESGLPAEEQQAILNGKRSITDVVNQYVGTLPPDVKSDIIKDLTGQDVQMYESLSPVGGGGGTQNTNTWSPFSFGGVQSPSSSGFGIPGMGSSSNGWYQ